MGINDTELITDQICINFFCFLISGSSGDIVLTQTPESQAVSTGDAVTIRCKASSSISTDRLHWYQQKPGQTPKLMLYHVTNRFTGVPDRFSGRYSGTDFTFTISGVQAEDAGDYYCGHDYDVPLTVIQSHTKTSSALQQNECEAEGSSWGSL
uniref:Ig-like domain-containing protein n=1 Tax=Sphenodon punctatus TaxID=8508 RepID=A0A8D0GK28_SPHPU